MNEIFPYSAPDKIESPIKCRFCGEMSKHGSEIIIYAKTLKNGEKEYSCICGLCSQGIVEIIRRERLFEL